ncbi:MAG: energy-coupling factor transporter transmembrane component T family protein [Actinomycetota bacterium]
MAVEYVRGTSALHGLDARTKILLFLGLTVIAIVIQDPVLIGVLFFALHRAGTRAVDPRMLNRNLRALVVIFTTFAAFQIVFFTAPDADVLFHLIPGTDLVPVTVEGIVRAVAVFFRFFIVVLAVHLMLYTTPPVELVLAVTRRTREQGALRQAGAALAVVGLTFAVGLFAFPDGIALAGLPPLVVLALGSVVVGGGLHLAARRGLPPEMGMALSIGFATVGLVSQQTQKITDAQRARGYDTKPKGVGPRIRVITALLLPIFLATLQRSQDIAVAILTRGFDADIDRRTYRRQLRFRRSDRVVIAGLAALLLVGVALERLGLATPTEDLARALVAH